MLKASNFGKLFERIINNRITPQIAAGQKSKATVDHLLRNRTQYQTPNT